MINIMKPKISHFHRPAPLTIQVIFGLRGPWNVRFLYINVRGFQTAYLTAYLPYKSKIPEKWYGSQRTPFCPHLMGHY